MKISYRILLINFVIVVIILGSSAFAFYSIMYNLLSSQQSKYLLNSANDLVYFYNELMQDVEFDFLYLMKDDVEPKLEAADLRNKSIDFILRRADDSSSSLNPIAYVKPVNINGFTFTLEEFRDENPYAIIRSYTHLDGIEYFFGTIVDEEELTSLSKKIGAEVVLVSNGSPAVFSNESQNNIFTYEINTGYEELREGRNFEIYQGSAENSEVLLTIIKPNNKEFTTRNIEFVVFTAIKEISDLKSNLKYLLIVSGFAGVVLSLILVFIFTEKIRRQITQLSKATETTRQGNFKSKIPFISHDEIGELAKAYNLMLEELDKNQRAKQEYSEFITLIYQNTTLKDLSDVALKKIIKTLGLSCGALFMADHGNVYYLNSHGIKEVNPSESELNLIKSAAKDKEAYEINSPGKIAGLSPEFYNQNLQYLLVQPILYNNKAVAVLELAGKKSLSSEDMVYLKKVLEQLAIGLTNAAALVQLENMIMELKKLNEDIQKQNVQITKQNETLLELHQKLKEKAEELEFQKRRAEESTQLKSQFLANMSHELRTPMNSIIGLTELVLDQSELNIKDKERISVVLNSGRRLMGLINDILDLSKIEAGKMELRFEEVILEEIIFEAETAVSPLIQNKNISFRVICNAEPKMIIRTDRGKVVQVLINILANAIKFTEKGSVVLEVSQPNLKELQFGVIDTGIGISEENKKVIFEEFRQIDESITKKYNGTGLGLAICKKIIDMLNGSINVESQPGKGSTFTITIPLEKVGLKLEPLIENEVTPKSEANSVLILEDNAETKLILLQYLTSLGYNAVSISPEELTESANIPGLLAVIVGMNLQHENAWRVIHNIKSNPTTEGVPVIPVMIKYSENRGIGIEVFDMYIKSVPGKLLNAINRASEVLGKNITKIAVIDTDQAEFLNVKSIFSRNDFVTLKLFPPGEKIFEEIPEFKPDLIITSFPLEEVDSIELIFKLKQRKDTRNIPVLSGLPAEISDENTYSLSQELDRNISYSTKHSLDILKIVRDKLKLLSGIHKSAAREEDIIHDASSLVSKDINNTISESNYRGNVLIVDDDPDTLFTINEIVQSLGNKTILARNGVECIETLTQVIPDLILLDIMMPEMDGFQTIKKIKEKKEWQNIPVFAVTAKAMVGDKEVIFKHRFDNYITKPVDASALAYKINSLFSNLSLS